MTAEHVRGAHVIRFDRGTGLGPGYFPPHREGNGLLRSDLSRFSYRFRGSLDLGISINTEDSGLGRFKGFAQERPLLFAVSLVVLYAMLATASYPLRHIFPAEEAGQIYAESGQKVLITAAFIFLLWGFRWLEPSGLGRIGRPRHWAAAFVVLAWVVVGQLYSFSGDLLLVLPSSGYQVGQVIYYFTGSILEEVMYRGLILISMLAAWGDSRRGVAKAIVVSSLVFGGMHLLNLAVDPLGPVLIQSIVVTLPGILYAVLVLWSRSLWPAIVVHWLTNVAVNLKLAGIEDYEAAIQNWLLAGLVFIPVTAFSFYMLRKLAPHEIGTGSKPRTSSRPRLVTR